MIIGISGRKGSGKSTVAGYLQDRIEGAVRISFADTLKLIAQEAFGALPEQVYGLRKNDRIAVCGLVARDVMQKVGQGMREIWPDCWVFAWERKVVEHWAMNGTGPVIVDDVRYPNEAKRIKEMGGILIRLDRAPYEDAHVSETALDDWKEWDCVASEGLNAEEAGRLVYDAVINAGIV